MIRTINVTKDYQAGDTVVHALRGVSLSIDKGEFIAIAGPSGSGKTTLLNLVGCLDKCTTGEIAVLGEPVAEKSKKELALFRRRHLGFVFQTFNLIPVLTAFENVSFVLSLLGISGDELKDRTMGILEEVGLKGMEYRFPRELSGGQEQRVAIARALIKEPDIVLADEPTANLDSATGEEILHLMQALNEKHGTTFVFSSHDKMVMDHAARLVQLHDGKITSNGILSEQRREK